MYILACVFANSVDLLYIAAVSSVITMQCSYPSLQMQDGENVKEVIQAVPTAQPCLVIKGKLQAIEDAVLIIEKAAVTKLNPKDAPLILLGSFYTFNMHYTDGCKNLLQFFFFEPVFPTKISLQRKLGQLLFSHSLYASSLIPKAVSCIHYSRHTFVCLLLSCFVLVYHSVCCFTCICYRLTHHHNFMFM